MKNGSENSGYTDTTGEVNHTSLENSHSNSDSSMKEYGDHCHKGKKTPDIDRNARRKLMIACLLSLIFMIGEIVGAFGLSLDLWGTASIYLSKITSVIQHLRLSDFIGGVLAHSLAIVSDAAHLLTDLASFLISLVAIYLASRPASKKLSFGWARAEIIGALISILLLWVLTGVLVFMGVERVINQSYEIDATIMLIIASCGVVFNLIMGFSLHQYTHHNHSHDAEGSDPTESDNFNPFSPTDSLVENETSYGTVQLENNSSDLLKNSGKKEHKRHFNLNVKAAFIHVVGDLIQSIGVLVAAIIIFFKPEYKLADPICTFIFSVLVLFTTITIIRDILVVLMEGTPKGMSMDLIKSSFLEIDGVCYIHDLRVWSLSLSKVALSVHLAVKAGTDPMLVLREATAKVQKEFNITETTIQVEEFVDDMVNCKMCEDLID